MQISIYIFEKLRQRMDLFEADISRFFETPTQTPAIYENWFWLSLIFEEAYSTSTYLLVLKINKFLKSGNL